MTGAFDLSNIRQSAIKASSKELFDAFNERLQSLQNVAVAAGLGKGAVKVRKIRGEGVVVRYSAGLSLARIGKAEKRSLRDNGIDADKLIDFAKADGDYKLSSLDLARRFGSFRKAGRIGSYGASAEIFENFIKTGYFVSKNYPALPEVTAVKASDFPSKPTVSAAEIVNTLVELKLLPARDRQEIGGDNEENYREIEINEEQLVKIALAFKVYPDRLKGHIFTDEGDGHITYGMGAVIYGICTQKLGNKFSGDYQHIPVAALVGANKA